MNALVPSFPVPNNCNFMVLANVDMKNKGLPILPVRFLAVGRPTHATNISAVEVPSLSLRFLRHLSYRLCRDAELASVIRDSSSWNSLPFRVLGAPC